MSTGNTELTPQFEVPLPPAGGETSQDQGMERPAPHETQRPSPQPKQTTTLPVEPPVIPATPPPAAPVADDDAKQPIASATRDLHADETDLIEKEWVDRAKQIVATTQDDPYKQKNEISKAKADYIQKRFNKTIKVDDAAVS